jgi:two-component system phosphate regulon sensor histidine kinase PhoR
VQETVKHWSTRNVLAGTLIVAALPLVAVEMFSNLKFVLPPDSYLLFHNVAEFFSVMVSLSMFGIGWYTYEQSKDRHALFLSIAFLGIGLMDFMHTFSNAAMPPFVTPNSSNKSTQFWIAVRLFQAVAFLVSAYVYPESPSRWLSKRVLMAFTLFVSFIVFTGITFFPAYVPDTFVTGVGLTPFKRISEYLVIGLLCASTAAYWRRMKLTGDRMLIYYLGAFVICILSEFPFAVYTRVFDTYNVLGHIYKVAAFSLIYYGVYRASVKAPYLSLTRVSEKLKVEIVERERTEESLRQARNNLEARVEKRTADLTQSNARLRTEIEDRQKAEEALRGSEERYRLLFENMTQGLALHEILTDVQGQPIDYRFLDVNPAFERLTGLKRADLLERCVTQVLPGTEDYWIEKYGRVALTGEPTHFENFSAPLGKWYDVLAYQCAPRQFAVVFSDITERKQAQHALRQSEERFRAIVSSTPDHVFVQDRNLCYTMVINPQLGLTEQDMIGKTDFDILVKEDAEKLTPIKRQVQETGKPVYVESPAISRDGKEEFFEGSYIPKFDAEGQCDGLIGYFRNVTERKRMEEELRRSRDELELRVKERTAELEHANERLKEENQERILLEQSIRLEEARLEALLHLSQITGASLKEITGFTLEQAIVLTQSKIGFVGFLNEDESVYTLHAVSKDVVKECNVTGDPVQWHVVDAGIWADAIRERKTVFVNDYSKPHPRKKGLPSGHPYVERFMVVPIFEGKRIVALAGVGNKASEYGKSEERQLVLLLSGMWGYVQRNRSKEELEKAYNKLESTNARLERQNRQLTALNRELQDFVFVASHDLQEPLRKVRTFGDMLVAKCGVSLDGASLDYLTRMKTAAARMQNLLNSLLTYSRLTTNAEPVKETDLNRSVEVALSNLEVFIKEKDARVEVGDLPTIEADRIQMVQLFQNLIENALKFSREGEAPYVKIYAQKLDDASVAYEICVEDNGIGFDEKYVDKIFLPFQRLHGRSSKYEGVGIGLAICRKVLERHGGTISAKSELGKGSTFIVTLPANRKRR